MRLGSRPPGIGGKATPLPTIARMAMIATGATTPHRHPTPIATTAPTTSAGRTVPKLEEAWSSVRATDRERGWLSDSVAWATLSIIAPEIPTMSAPVMVVAGLRPTAMTREPRAIPAPPSQKTRLRPAIRVNDSTMNPATTAPPASAEKWRPPMVRLMSRSLRRVGMAGPSTATANPEAMAMP